MGPPGEGVSEPAPPLVPEELEQAFAFAPGARERFELLSPGHQRAHVDHIIEAKRTETRKSRALKTIETLLRG